MSELHLNFINPKNLIARLNKDIIEADGYLSLGKAMDHSKPTSSFFDRFQNRVIDAKKQYPIVQTVQSSFPFAEMFGIEKDLTIGYLLLEEGHYEYEGLFVNAEFRIWRPFELEEDWVPHCTIKISVVTPKYSNEEDIIERVDHVKKFHLYWKKTDLSDIIPTELFLP